MNMVFSGVTGSRPAREGLLTDGDGKRTIKGRDGSHAGRPTSGKHEDFHDNASISASLRSPGTMTTGIGNVPTALAIMVMIGPGPSGPALAASTSIAMSTSF